MAPIRSHIYWLKWLRTKEIFRSTINKSCLSLNIFKITNFDLILIGHLESVMNLCFPRKFITYMNRSKLLELTNVEIGNQAKTSESVSNINRKFAFHMFILFSIVNTKVGRNSNKRGGRYSLRLRLNINNQQARSSSYQAFLPSSL